MNDFQNKLKIIKSNANKDVQKILCLRSIENFVLYFDELSIYHSKVQSLLVDYFKTVDEILNDAGSIINFETCKFLVKSYIVPIGRYYRWELNFQIQPSITSMLFWGIQIDILLFIFGTLKKIDYIPVVTIVLVIYWLYHKIFFANRNRAYGVKY